MIFAVFLCTAYIGRPELDVCQRMGMGPFQTEEQCKAEMARLREQDHHTGLEGYGKLQNVQWHRELICKGKPTWTNVD